MNKILKIFFFIYKNPKKKIIKFIFFSILALILEVISIGAIYPFINSIFNNNRNFILNGINLNIENKNIIIILCVAIILIFILKNIYYIFFIYWQNKFSQNIYKITSVFLLNNYMSQKYNFFYKNNTSTLINNVYVESKNFSFAIASLLKLFSELLVLSSVILFLFFFQFYVALSLLTFFLVFSFFYKIFVKKFFNQWGRQRTYFGTLMLRELKVIFEGIKTIKIMHKENYFINEFKKYIKNFSKSAILQSTFAEFPKIFFEIISVFLIIIFVIYNIETNINPIDFLAVLAVFVVAGFRLLPAFNRIIVSYQNIIYYSTTVNIIYNSYYEKLNYDNSHASKNENLDAINFNNHIKIDSLNFNHDGKDYDFFQEISLLIKKNDCIGLVGESGSGKSTLINLISCLYSFNNGFIEIDNLKINTDYRVNLWQNKIGYVSQATFIKEGTVKDNIAFGVQDNQIDNEKVIKAMRSAELESFLNKIDYNLNTNIKESGINLSLGEQQRFGIARALYNDCDLFILDEPTSSLDKDTEENFINFLNKFSKNKTVIIISHKLSNTEFCNKIFKIEQENDKRKIIQIK
jgi:ABC-type multidrug transport system fused ATPase/permease subunit